MEFLSTVSFVIGTIGLVIYLCLITIRFTAQAARLRAAIKTRDDRIGHLRQKLLELTARREAMDPEVDQLVSRMIELREQRDRLCFQYDEMVARSRDREINIGYHAR